MRVQFKNLEPSELAREITRERLGGALDKFPWTGSHYVSVTLSMENSPVHAGADSFSVKLMVDGHELKQLVIEKSSGSLYAALAEVAEILLERINRLNEKNRDLLRKRRRTFLKRNRSGNIQPTTRPGQNYAS